MKLIRAAFVLSFFVAVLYSCTNDKGLLPPAPKAVEVFICDSVKYGKDVQPLFNTYCVSCHFAGNPQGISDFTNYANTSADTANIMSRAVVLKDMPQAGNPAPSDAERERIRCWIVNGAKNN